MAYLSKFQVKQILDKAPPNLDKGKLVEALVKQGNVLEGLNDQGINTRSQEDSTQETKSVGGFAGNVIKSGLDLVKNTANAVIHPIQTAKSIGNIALGAAEKLVPGRQGAEDSFDSLVNFYKQRYGSVDSLKETVYNDPIGFASDVATVLGAGGAALRVAGKAGKAESLVNAGNVASKAANFADPLIAPTEVAKRIIPTSFATKSATRLYQSALKPSTKLDDAQRASMIATALEDGIPVTKAGLEKTQGVIDEVNNSIASLIQDAADNGAEVSTAAVRNRLDDVFEFVSQTVNPDDHIAELAKIERSFLSTYGDTIPIDVAQKVKQNTYTLLRKAYGEMKSSSVEAQKALARGLKEEIVKQYPEIASLNSKDSALINLEGSLERAVGRIDNQQLIGIGTPIAGGAAKAVTGSNKLGAIAAILKSVFDNPEVKSKLAIALSRVSKRKFGKPGIVRRSTTPLVRLTTPSREYNQSQE